VNDTAVPYVGLRRRLLAAVIDNLIWVVFYFLFYGSLVGALYDVSPGAGFIAFFVYASIWFNYFAFMEWRTGQTLGKIAAEVEVRSLDGKPRLSFGQASVRGLLRLVDFFVVGWVLIAATERKQRLGDLAAKTVVLPKKSQLVRETPAFRGAAPDPRPAESAAGAGSVEAGTADVEESRLPRVTWDASDAGWGLVGGLVLAVVVVPFLVVPFDPDLSSDASILVLQALLGGTLLVVALGMASRWKFTPLRETLGKLGVRNFRWSGIGTAMLTLLAYYIAVALFSAFVLQPDQEDIGGELGIGDDNVLVAVTAVLLIAVLAPISEELFFRGFVFGGMRQRFSLWPAALIAGGIFGLIHAPTGPSTVFPLAALGIALCWLYDRTGSLWPCLFAHAFNNALALAVTA
jgi:uncharacterized protein